MICYALKDLNRILWGSHIRISEITTNLEATTIHGKKICRTLRCVNSLSTLLSEKKILIFDYYPSLIDLSLFQLMKKKWNIMFDVADIPYLQAIHLGASTTIDQELKRNFLHLTKLADRLLFISPKMIELEPQIPRNKRFFVVPNASNPDHFQSTPLPHEEKKTILCVSGYAPYRGIEMLIAAFHLLRKKKQNISLKLVGHNVPSRLKTEGVTIERNRYYANMPEVFSNSYVCVVPHLKNLYTDCALPIKLFDAMASSRPSIVTNCFEMRKLVEEENCGLASECDAESLSEAIDHLLSNRRIAEEMGLKGREAIEKRHSWKHRAEIIKTHFM